MLNLQSFSKVGARPKATKETVPDIGTVLNTAYDPETFPPVTMGHIRGHGCRDLLVYCGSSRCHHRDLLIYCGSGRCHHSATMNGDSLPDDLPVRSLCGRMVCTVCGMIGADVRPDWSPHVNKLHV